MHTIELLPPEQIFILSRRLSLAGIAPLQHLSSRNPIRVHLGGRFHRASHIRPWLACRIRPPKSSERI